MEAAMDRPRLLAGLLRRVGDYNLQTFSDRLILQKTVYLLQAFGIYLGYQFNWYLRGPYSPQLAKDAFGLDARWSRFDPVKFTNDVAEQRLMEFLAFVAGHKKDEGWLETTASAHFLAKVYGITDKGLIFEKIKRKQPRVTRKAFEDCWHELETDRLI
jgi:uncharacterized protein YwgA